MSRRFDRALGGIALEFMLLIPTLFGLYDLTHRFTSLPSWLTFPVWAISFVLYGSIPIIYCAVVSFRQRKKKIVSPRLIGTSTIVIVGLVVEITQTLPDSYLYAPSLIVFVQNFLVFAVCFVLAVAILGGLLGYYQTQAVRWLVGPNEGTPASVTYRVHIPFAKVQKDVTEAKAFLDWWSLVIVPHEPSGELVLKCRVNWRGIREDIFVIVAPDAKNGALIHGAGFVEDLYEIRADERATERRDRIISDLVGLLGVTKGEPLSQPDPQMVKLTRQFVSEYTRSKFTVARGMIGNLREIWSRMEKHRQNVIILTGLAWALADGLFGFLHFSQIPFDVSVAVDANLGMFGLLVVQLVLPALRSKGKHD